MAYDQVWLLYVFKKSLLLVEDSLSFQFKMRDYI